jgi:type IX secretion system PorP/SprF family membrane protein
MQKTYVYILIILAHFNGWNGLIAQQEHQLSNALFSPYLYNPAAGGMVDVIQIDMTARTQWTGYEGGPKTMLVSGSSQFGRSTSKKQILSTFSDGKKALFSAPVVSTAKKKHVVGGKIYSDAAGVFVKTAFQLQYARHLMLTRKLNIGAGFGMGYSQFRINDSKAVLFQTNDDFYNQILANGARQHFLDAQVGLVVYGKNLFMGYSATQMLNNAISFKDLETDGRYQRHHFISFKYGLPVTESICIEPAAVLKLTRNAPLSADVGFRVLYNRSAWFGMQYRTTNSLSFQLGSTLIKNLYIGYAFEQGIGKIRTATNGTHELQLGYFIGRKGDFEKQFEKPQEKEK